MRRRRAVLLAVAAVAVPVAVFGTAGFSLASADRQVAVDVVGDDDAFMALEYADEPVDLRGAEQYDEHVLTVRNRFGVPVDARVSVGVVTSDGIAVNLSTGSGTAFGSDAVGRERIGVGAELDITANVSCLAGGDQTASLAFDVSAHGRKVHAETTESRTVELSVTCPRPTTAPGGTSTPAASGTSTPAASGTSSPTVETPTATAD